jgi:dolichyl-phosphate beta-glucosyltransferase
VLAVQRLRDFANRQGLDAELITCGELSPGLDPEADRHVQVVPTLKGRCVREGVLASHGAYIIVLDADVPIEDEDICDLLTATTRSEVVIGDRRGGRSMRRPLARRVASIGYKVLVGCLFGVRKLDVQSGAKGFQATSARHLFIAQTVRGLAYDLEVVLNARDEGMCIEQIPVSWSHTDSTISLWKAVPGMLFEVLALRARRWWNRLKPSQFSSFMQFNKV